MLASALGTPVLSSLPGELEFPSPSLRQLISALGTVDLSCDKVATLIRPGGFQR
jgi:hypothetical protein